ncbi:MAG: AmmeMemoRadiSam system radical SAM enzyme [Pseudomonadota bacterium]|nr:AmmeMemoRadiSam system radical SAM enzyme [Pseudomonadota bacterium]
MSARSSDLSFDNPGTVPARFWHRIADGRIQCDLCPRYCKLREGQRGLCFVRARMGDQMVLTTYGRSSGFAIDTARACKARGIRSVAESAGYVCPAPRAEFYQVMDAANIDLKGFTEAFYRKLTGGSLAPVLDTLQYLRHETDVWLELTTLLIPGHNDSDHDLDVMTRWVVENLGPDVPMHFTAFHPDYKMLDIPPTPAETLSRARRIAMDNGVRYAFTGNVFDPQGASTYCHQCGAVLIGRDGYAITEWKLAAGGGCSECGARCAGVFENSPSDWGPRSQPVRLKNFSG